MDNSEEVQYSDRSEVKNGDVEGKSVQVVELESQVLDPLPELGADMRKEFMLRPGCVFLNHGSYGSMPRCVHEKQVR